MQARGAIKRNSSSHRCQEYPKNIIKIVHIFPQKNDHCQIITHVKLKKKTTSTQSNNPLLTTSNSMKYNLETYKSVPREGKTLHLIESGVLQINTML